MFNKDAIFRWFFYLLIFQKHLTYNSGKIKKKDKLKKKRREIKKSKKIKKEIIRWIPFSHWLPK